MTPKAELYVERLDRARCEGNWDTAQDLIRKVRKYAPDRSCLILTAEAECAIAKVTTTAQSRPLDSQRARDLDLTSRIPKLLSAIEKENGQMEDRFQAQVCIGWLHWLAGEYNLALVRLPKSIDDQECGIDPAASVSEWTHVCALKSAYLRANCLNRDDRRRGEALAALRSGFPGLGPVWAGRGVGKQLRYWSELFLSDYCLVSGEAMRNDELPLSDPLSIMPFRAWAKYWLIMQSPLTGGYGLKTAAPRRQIWNDYYAALSRILQENLPYLTGHVDSISADLAPRAQLRTELAYVETAYRSLLLAETTFPRADEERAEVEAFVGRLMKNWSILCGRGWRDQDLGPGGRRALSRRTLDALYLAASRTYHSAAILRSLFSLHLALADFDLAFRSFDCYLATVKKAKARARKTGRVQPGMDDDDGTVLETMAQAIIALCRYGHQEACEKARRIGADLEDWLSKLPQMRVGPEVAASSMPEGGQMEEEGQLPDVAPSSVALAWQAIGLAHARWSRLTAEAGIRTEIQSKAIRCLRKSLAAEFGRSKDVRSLFSLALLLAERRDLAAAIDVVRLALMSVRNQDDKYDLIYGPYWQERSLIPLWHLLALLMSARQDYLMAFRACEGAQDQFKDPAILFGKPHATEETDEAAATAVGEAATEQGWGLVDDMDDWEKESILEVKMTELALVEVVEGPDAAVNRSHQLLTLFARLFGSVTAEMEAAAATTTMTTTAAAAVGTSTSTRPTRGPGALVSIRGSIFGPSKPDRWRLSARRLSATATSEKPTMKLSRPPTSQSTDWSSLGLDFSGEDVQGGGVDDDRTVRSRRSSFGQGSRSKSGVRSSLKKASRNGSRPRPASMGGAPVKRFSLADGQPFFAPVAEFEVGPQGRSLMTSKSPPPAASSSRASAREKPVSMFNSFLSATADEATESEPNGNGQANGTSTMTTTMTPLLLPLILLTPKAETRRRTAMLAGIWLFIAGFYRRAALLDDGKAAIAEAQKLVHALETEAAGERPEATEMGGPSWADWKSIDGLWGDVWSELGSLALAQGSPQTARSDFECALGHCANHAGATVGLCNILLDIYSQDLRPRPAVAPLLDDAGPGSRTLGDGRGRSRTPKLPWAPLGLGRERRGGWPDKGPDSHGGEEGDGGGGDDKVDNHGDNDDNGDDDDDDDNDDDERLPAPYKASSLPLADRLAARDRAFSLLSGLTRLGNGWDLSEAWFALARAHEESGEPDKAQEMLWWCVELEEAAGLRPWRCLDAGAGYLA